MDPLPSPGTRLRNPFTGEVFLFTDVDETAESFRFDVLIEPGGMTTGTGRQHLHPDADETFLVREGRLRLMVDGVWHELGPGQSMTVTKGVPHLFRNGHGGATWLTATFTPAQQFLRFFLNMGLNLQNHPEWYDARGEPPLALQALALHAYAGHGYGDGIPVWVQRVVFAALTPVALLRGYRLAIRPRKALRRRQ